MNKRNWLLQDFIIVSRNICKNQRNTLTLAELIPKTYKFTDLFKNFFKNGASIRDNVRIVDDKSQFNVFSFFSELIFKKAVSDGLDNIFVIKLTSTIDISNILIFGFTKIRNCCFWNKALSNWCNYCIKVFLNPIFIDF